MVTGKADWRPLAPQARRSLWMGTNGLCWSQLHGQAHNAIRNEPALEQKALSLHGGVVPGVGDGPWTKRPGSAWIWTSGINGSAQEACSPMNYDHKKTTMKKPRKAGHSRLFRC
jgi:hypothetical protein